MYAGNTPLSFGHGHAKMQIKKKYDIKEIFLKLRNVVLTSLGFKIRMLICIVVFTRTDFIAGKTDKFK